MTTLARINGFALGLFQCYMVRPKYADRGTVVARAYADIARSYGVHVGYAPYDGRWLVESFKASTAVTGVSLEDLRGAGLIVWDPPVSKLRGRVVFAMPNLKDSSIEAFAGLAVDEDRVVKVRVTKGSRGMWEWSRYFLEKLRKEAEQQ
ncbi:hypothetical protein ACFL59_11915 [Planctomycetota bacterium]